MFTINVVNPHWLQHLAGGKIPQDEYNAIFDYYTKNGGPEKEDELGNWAVFPALEDAKDYYDDTFDDVCKVWFPYRDHILLLEN